MRIRLFLLSASTLMVLPLQGCVPVVAAGVGTGVVMAQDRRSSEVFIEDQRMETKISGLIASELKGVMHVNVTSFNLNVLLTGEVPEEYTKAEIIKLVARLDKVRAINDELVVAANSSVVSRSNDSLTTSNVKLRFLKSGGFNAEHVKVVTENGTVYLLGLVTHVEADAAAEVARTTGGVKGVVKLFEYLD
jgi:osmotically-inducible protein OsmY